MPKIVPIVEGQGEVVSVPILLYKLLHDAERFDIQVARPLNSKGCGSLLKSGGLEKFVEAAWLEPECGAVLVFIDADEGCPMDLARRFALRIHSLGVRHAVVIIAAKCEYEAWFLASLDTISGKELQGRPGLPTGLTYEGDCETRLGVKGWLSAHFPRGRAYKETEDQAAMTRLLDIALTKDRSRSFRRLCHALEEALQAIDSNTCIVTPHPIKG